jgi:hypothetical protein
MDPWKNPEEVQMNPVNLLRSLLRSSAPAQDLLLLRLDGIRGHRLDTAAPALTAFSPRPSRRRVLAS